MIFSLIEICLGKLLYSFRGRDAGLLINSSLLLNNIPAPNLTISSTLGDSPSRLDPRYTGDGADEFPPLAWEFTSGSDVGRHEVKEWIVLVEDPDAPLPYPICHGVFYGIPASRTSVTHQDLGNTDKGCGNEVKGGFKHGWNIRGKKWDGPKPVMGHGVHRYMFAVIGLGKGVDWKAVEQAEKVGMGVGRTEVEKVIAGKVLAWGVWIGEYERVW